MGKLLLGITALLVTALLAGCGNGGGGDTLTKDEYEERVNAAARELAVSFEQIGKEAQTIQSDVAAGDTKELFAKLADVVAKGEENLRAVADELDSLSPPDDAGEANDKLAAGLNAMADDFGGLAAALAGGSVVDVVMLGRKLQDITSSEGGKLIQDAIQTLEKAGYRFSDVG